MPNYKTPPESFGSAGQGIKQSIAISDTSSKRLEILDIKDINGNANAQSFHFFGGTTAWTATGKHYVEGIAIWGTTTTTAFQNTIGPSDTADVNPTVLATWRLPKSWAGYIYIPFEKFNVQINDGKFLTADFNGGAFYTQAYVYAE